ncbi:MAG: hypothetical protein JWM95_473 [Gemmatimonadetes bacterium]|nr:hypothetical protein [Gemmatimonadota bacterium]
MKLLHAAAVLALPVLAACIAARQVPRRSAMAAAWDARGAAAYLDGRQGWWQTWPTASRDHGTSCVSCHTALPYALSRPALAGELHETESPAAERKLLDDVRTRAVLWKDVEPFYPDQTRGIPKTSESRGTEAVLNALILAVADARRGRASDEGRAAFANMWALQFRSGDISGAWAWLNFHLAPWESDDATFFGATLAAVAVGTAPEEYAARPELEPRLKLLREYLRRQASTQGLYNRASLLWASSRLPGLLSAGERTAIVEALFSAQHADGGWGMPSLGQWKRSDGSTADDASDGLATGFVSFAMQEAGLRANDSRIASSLAWLVQHQNRATGQWTASSVNKKRDGNSDTGKFMSDAATAYAVLALTRTGVR